MMITIAQMWLAYLDDVVPKGAPQVQLQETKRAFYAGVKAALGILTEIGDDTISEDQGVAIIEAMHEECRAFINDVLEGRA
jgi:hypothetical protein